MNQFAFADLLFRDAAALVIMKTTVVLVLASGAAMAAKGFSAARRHMLWLVALSSCAWLALASPLAPAIVIHAPILAVSAVTPATRRTVGSPPPSRGIVGANTSGVRERFPIAEARRRPALGSIPLPSHPLIAIWIVGCLVLLARDAIGFAGATRLGRRAAVANDDETARELASAAAAVGGRRRIFLGYSVEVESPIAIGISKPLVLLPVEAKLWSAARRRVVVLHEAAHVSRGDCLSQAIGRFACALFWFHPLVWRALAHLRAEAERAADDRVLSAGIPAPEYATNLLELARLTSNVRPNLVAVGILSTTHLERRFVAMFDTRRSRAIVTSRAQMITTSVALAVICPLASLRVAAPVPPRYALVQQEAPQHASLPQPASVSRAAAPDLAASRIPQSADARAAIVPDRAPENSLPTVAVVDNPAPSVIVHPDFSGKWASDTIAVPNSDGAVIVADSNIIMQTQDAISFDQRGHILTPSAIAQVRYFLPNLTFDGAPASGVTSTGNTATNVVATAVWEGDTLVLTSHTQVAGKNSHTIERITLSPDRKTLSDTNVSFVDGKDRWGGAITVTLRRIAP